MHTRHLPGSCRLEVLPHPLRYGHRHGMHVGAGRLERAVAPRQHVQRGHEALSSARGVCGDLRGLPRHPRVDGLQEKRKGTREQRRDVGGGVVRDAPYELRDLLRSQSVTCTDP